MEAIAKAQMEINAIEAERKVATAFSKNTPQYTDYIFIIEDCASVYSETQKKVDRFIHKGHKRQRCLSRLKRTDYSTWEH